jgi:hypothetical protein
MRFQKCGNALLAHEKINEVIGEWANKDTVFFYVYFFKEAEPIIIAKPKK